MATSVPSRQVRHGRAVLAGAHEVAGVDGGGGEAAGLRDVRAAPGPPQAAGLGAVGFGGFVAHDLEGVAPVGQVLGAGGGQLQLARLDLGAVLGALQVAQVGQQPVGGAVEALGLGVEHVDEAPHQAFALVGKLEAVRRDAPGQDAEGFGHGGHGVVAVPDVAAVELVASGGRAVTGEAVAGESGCRCGVFGLVVVGGLEHGGVKAPGVDAGNGKGVCHGGVGGACHGRFLSP